MNAVRLPAVLVVFASLAGDAFARSGVPASDPTDPTAFRVVGSRIRASNPSQRFDVAIDEAGALVTPADDAAASWSLRIGTLGVAREQGALHAGPPSLVAGEHRVRLLHDSFEEWFVHERDGLEHGWTLHRPPPGDGAVWIALRIETDLLVRAADDGRSAKLTEPDGRLALRYHGLHAWDARGTPLDARLVPSPTGLGIRVDDTDAVYPVTVDPYIAAAWTFEPDQGGAGPNDLFVCTAGDVNGDGFSDILIGVPGFDVAGNVDAGKVWVFHGASGGPSATPSWTVESTTPGFLLGSGLSTAGDVNGDGYDDIVVRGGNDAGAVLYAWYGSASGLQGGGTLATANFTWQSADPGAAEFARLAYAGDVNGDGYSDVIAGSPGWDVPGFANGGRVFLFFGSATGLTSTPVWTSEGVNQVNAYFGAAVSGAGDVNGDGYDDVIAAGPEWVTAPGVGRVFGYHGRPDFNFQTTWFHAPEGFNALAGNSEQYGYAIAGAGDVNGDGYADVMIGSPGADDGQQDEGMIFVYHGSSTGLSTSYSGVNESDQGGTLYGYSVSTAGDVNGDGYADGIVGGLGYAATAGMITVIEGGPSGLCGICFGSLAGQVTVESQPLARLGATVSAAGDVDGDGFTDVLASARLWDGGQNNEGRVQLFLGRPDAAVSATGPVLADGSAVDLGGALALLDLGSDGRQDLVVGAPGAVAGRGRLYLHPGTANGAATTPAWTVQGPVGGRLGTALARAGDVNGDGFEDLLAGMPDFDGATVDEGRALLYLGTPSGIPSTSASWIFTSGVQDARFGAAVAGAGDVNGDGFADVWIGAPGTWLGQVDRGSAWLFLGTATGLAATPAGTRSDGGIGSRFGASVAGAGDLNGDGYSDVVVGAPGFTGTPPSDQSGEGAVFAYLGTGTSLSPSPVWTREGETIGARLGAAVAGASDVNGDGRADVLVGSPGLGAGGQAFLHLGSSSAPYVVSTPATTLVLTQPGAEFGATVAAAGDANGDGFADALVGAPLHDGAQTNAGRVTLHLGNSLGLSAGPAWSVDGAALDAHLGSALAGAGDLEGDGFSDHAVGAPGAGGGSGQADLFYGGGGTTAVRVNTQQRAYNDLQGIALLGRSETTNSFSFQLNTFNAQGSPSAPAQGRSLVRAQYEVEILGAPLDGISTLQGAWTDTGPVLVTNLLELQTLASGLSGSENYHWRVRLESKRPFFPHSRWFTIQGNAREETKVGTAFDCNGNGTPDDQELLGNDCNGNQVPDDCDISFGTSSDCDPVDTGIGPNGTPDECDIALGAPDSNNDGVPDECQSALVLYCFGDGSGTPCPCGNSSPPGSQKGCANSIVASGGSLRASGVPVVSADNLVLAGSGMPNSSALYFQGTAQQSGGAGAVFGDGLRCAGGATVRLGTKSNAAGSSQYPAPGDLSISVRGFVPVVGATRTYQVWYRNSAAFCTVSVFNLTNGVQAVWQP